MQIVEVGLASEDELASLLQEMRAWLGARFFAPSEFTSGRSEGVTTLRVDFAVPLEAFAFARRFGGTIISSAAE